MQHLSNDRIAWNIKDINETLEIAHVWKDAEKIAKYSAQLACYTTEKNRRIEADIVDMLEICREQHDTTEETAASIRKHLGL